jgi:hypothetical protein
MLETPGDHSVAADGATDSPEVPQYRFRLRPDPQPRGRLRATRAAVTAAAWGLGSRCTRSLAPTRRASPGPDLTDQVGLHPSVLDVVLRPYTPVGSALPMPARWRQPESQSISQPETPVCVVGPLDRRGRGVAGQHVVRAPAGQHHQVSLLSSSSQPPVGEGVPESVRVHVGDARLGGPPVQHLPEPVGRHRPALAEQQPGRAGVRVQRPDAQVAVDRLRGLRPERHHPRA